MADLGRNNWDVVKRILKYIKGILSFALCFEGSEFFVKGYVNLAFVGDLDKRKSTIGYVFTLARGVIVIALSMTKVEYMAATQACKEAIWIQRLMEELGHKQQKIFVYCDSYSAFHITRNLAFHYRTKHIGVQYHFVRELIEEGSVDM
ncbi:hypothetical protein CR513_23598, partial [Mucuna pruriens]